MLASVPELIEIAKTASDLESRVRALTALGKIEDPRSIDILKVAIQSKFPSERLAALRSLFHIDKKGIASFEEALVNDQDPLVRNWMHYYQKVGK
jgi:HEAT repeat protein